MASMNTLKARIAIALWELDSRYSPSPDQLYRSEHGRDCLRKAETAIKIVKDHRLKTSRDDVD